MKANFAVPVTETYLEDYLSGSTYELQRNLFERKGDRRFCKALRSAGHPHRSRSGGARAFWRTHRQRWHTAAVMMRPFADHYLSHVAAIASPGVEELRRLLPVRPGNSLFSNPISIITCVRTLTLRSAKTSPRRFPFSLPRLVA